MISFFVEGVPAPQGSKTAMPVRKNGQLTGKVNMIESSKALMPWRGIVAHHARVARSRTLDRPYSGPVRVVVTFWFDRPKSHYGTGRNAGTLKPSAPEHHVTKPDIDKLLRAILDALTMAMVYKDDSQVVEVVARKHYADSMPPGASITVEPMPSARELNAQALSNL